MQEPARLFDETALRAHRQRARHSDPKAWFLHDIAIEQISEKLADVNRQFKDVAIVGPKAEYWKKNLNIAAQCMEDREVLDLRHASCDLVVHAMALHWADDPVGQLVQMRQALKPDGLMLAVLFGGQTLNELRISLAHAETQNEGGISPRVSPMGEIRTLGGLLQRAGYALPVADNFMQKVDYLSAFALMRDLRSMAENNALAARRKTFFRRKTLEAASSFYSQNFAQQDHITASFEFVFLTGWAPSATQQKPLKPGSARQRLAKALSTTEYNPEQDV